MYDTTALSDVWQARPDDSEHGWGGWCVQPAGEQPPSKGGKVLACLLSEALAVHVVKAHNKLLSLRLVV